MNSGEQVLRKGIIPVAVALLTLSAGCGTFRSDQLPRIEKAAMSRVGQSGRAHIYVTERLESPHKPVWHGSSGLGALLNEQLDTIGHNCEFLGLSLANLADMELWALRESLVNQTRGGGFASISTANGMIEAQDGKIVSSTAALERINRTMRLPEGMEKGSLWLDVKTLYRPGNFAVSIPLAVLSGLTLTVVPATETYACHAKIVARDEFGQALWNKTYEDGYRLTVWLPLFPLVFSSEHNFSVPTEVIRNMSRHIVQDLSTEGIVPARK